MPARLRSEGLDRYKDWYKMDDWLWAWMVRTGLARADGVGQRIKPYRCVCGDTVLRGLDSEVCAVVVSVDVGGVDALGEAVALLQGRRTYTLLPLLHRSQNSFCLIQRTAAHISRKTVHPVLIQHICGSHIPKVPSRLYRPWPDEPPF